MNASLRLFLVVGALAVLVAIAQRIRKQRIQMQDAIFWVVLAGVLVLVALFPGLAYSVSDALGITSPSNFVFLVTIAVLLVKCFANASEISLLKARVNQLSQELGLAEAEKREEA